MYIARLLAGVLSPGPRARRSASCFLVIQSAVGLALLCVAMIIDTASADSLDDETRRIAKTLQCPVCQGVSVADSTSELAGQMQMVIRRKLEEGATATDIQGYFVERYGEGVLLEPPRRGWSLVVWAMPVTVLLGGALALSLTLRVWLRPRPPIGPRGDRFGPHEPVSNGGAPGIRGARQSRARAELERFRGDA